MEEKNSKTVRTMRNSAIWKYSPNHAFGCTVNRQRQSRILVAQTEIALFGDDLIARPAFTSVMSPALHDAADGCLVDGSSAP